MDSQVIGKVLPRKDGISKVCGRKTFANDIVVPLMKKISYTKWVVQFAGKISSQLGLVLKSRSDGKQVSASKSASPIAFATK